VETVARSLNGRRRVSTDYPESAKFRFRVNDRKRLLLSERDLIIQAVPRLPYQPAVPDDTRKFPIGPRLTLDSYVYDGLTL